MHNINGKQPNPYLHYSCLFINNTSYSFYRPVNNGQKDPVAEKKKTLRVSWIVYIKKKRQIVMYVTSNY